jgi:hypothetical protein
MTWKSYAAASGATVLAGWMASTPAVDLPVARQANPARAPRAETAAQTYADIEEQAARLQVRVRRELAFSRPQRNPFRFEDARPPEPAAVLGVPAAPVEAPPLPTAPLVTLAGIAEDGQGDGVERTAVISSSSGVHLVRAGDELLGLYRVGAIEGDAVELVNVSDGSTVRLSFASPALR